MGIDLMGIGLRRYVINPDIMIITCDGNFTAVGFNANPCYNGSPLGLVVSDGVDDGILPIQVDWCWEWTGGGSDAGQCRTGQNRCSGSDKLTTFHFRQVS